MKSLRDGEFGVHDRPGSECASDHARKRGEGNGLRQLEMKAWNIRMKNGEWKLEDGSWKMEAWRNLGSR